MHAIFAAAALAQLLLLNHGGLFDDDPLDPLEEFKRSLIRHVARPRPSFSGDLFSSLDGEASSLFSLFGDPMLHSGVGRGFDFTETPSGLEVSSRLHGVDPATIEVTVSHGMLVVAGEQRGENFAGSFQRTFSLPPGARVRANESTAAYNGSTEVLTITLPTSPRGLALPPPVEAAGGGGGSLLLGGPHDVRKPRRHAPPPSPPAVEERMEDGDARWAALRHNVHGAFGDLRELAGDGAGAEQQQRWMASASKPGRLFDSVVSRHFDDYAKEVATSEPKGLQWKLNWTMHDHGATTLHLAADLPADLAVGDALPTATVDGHVLTVEVPKLFKRSVALPAHLDNEGLEVVWDDARRRLLVTGRLKAGGEADGDEGAGAFAVPVRKDEL